MVPTPISQTSCVTGPQDGLGPWAAGPEPIVGAATPARGSKGLHLNIRDVMGVFPGGGGCGLTREVSSLSLGASSGVQTPER